VEFQVVTFTPGRVEFQGFGRAAFGKIAELPVGVLHARELTSETTACGRPTRRAYRFPTIAWPPPSPASACAACLEATDASETSGLAKRGESAPAHYGGHQLRPATSAHRRL